MKYVLKNQIIRLVCFLIPSAKSRTRFIKRNNLFGHFGENIHFQPRKIPADPKLVKIHDNCCIASEVLFINHDIIHFMLNRLEASGEIFKSQAGCIEIMNNVFIGSRTILFPNVRIGNNVIIAAGSCVTKDLPSNGVYAGVPAKFISSFEDFVNKRKEKNVDLIEGDRNMISNRLWAQFYEERSHVNNV